MSSAANTPTVTAIAVSIRRNTVPAAAPTANRSRNHPAGATPETPNSSLPNLVKAGPLCAPAHASTAHPIARPASTTTRPTLPTLTVLNPG